MTTATKPTKTIEQSSGNEVRKAMLRLCHDLSIITVDPDIVVDEVISRCRQERQKVLNNQSDMLKVAQTLTGVHTALLAFDEKIQTVMRLIVDNVLEDHGLEATCRQV